MAWDLESMGSGARLLRALSRDGSSDCLFLLCWAQSFHLGQCLLLEEGLEAKDAEVRSEKQSRQTERETYTQACVLRETDREGGEGSGR